VEESKSIDTGQRRTGYYDILRIDDIQLGPDKTKFGQPVAGIVSGEDVYGLLEVIGETCIGRRYGGITSTTVNSTVVRVIVEGIHRLTSSSS